MTSVEVFTRPAASLPAVVALTLWRWRWELAILAALLYVYDWTNDQHLSTAELVLLAEIPVVILAVPVTRHFVRNRLWCVITRHRLRLCMAEVRAMNYSGNLPFLIGTRSTNVGERVWLWLRPGLSIEELANRTEQFAAACWARDARITRSRNLATLVRIDVVRRDPLGRESIASPLMTFKRPKRGGPIPSQPPAGIAPATAFRVAKAKGETAKPPCRRTDAPSASTTQPSTPPVVGLNGEDITDYV
jgi:hypothetical protein